MKIRAGFVPEQAILVDSRIVLSDEACCKEFMSTKSTTQFGRSIDSEAFL